MASGLVCSKFCRTALDWWKRAKICVCRSGHVSSRRALRDTHRLDVLQFMRSSAELTSDFHQTAKDDAWRQWSQREAAQMFIHGYGRGAVRSNETADDPCPLVTSRILRARAYASRVSYEVGQSIRVPQLKPGVLSGVSDASETHTGIYLKNARYRQSLHNDRADVLPQARYWRRWRLLRHSTQHIRSIASSRRTHSCTLALARPQNPASFQLLASRQLES